MKNIFKWALGKPKDPLSPAARHTMALTILFAWVGLGADGISSSCYGPEQSFLALGNHAALSMWLALLMMVTVFVIAFSYNCVISLFPDGGGGYKVATRLLGEKWGLIAGAALILDYLLTIVISVASGTSALFSLLPPSFWNYRLEVDAVIIIFLTYINMRGAKESIKFLLPIFVGFILLHVGIIFYGLIWHPDGFLHVTHLAHQNSKSLFHQFGLFLGIAFFLQAYAQGGGTYTGLEAVSNNVNTLAQPKVRTAKWTMFLMAVSLSFIAGGILLLYLLWQVHPASGRTLNAVVFGKILGNSLPGHVMLLLILIFEAGLLYVASNTGFLGGPSVLANMAGDDWVPKQFASISARLVKQNGILLFGLGGLLLLFVTGGHVHILVILYSVSVFLAFTVALAGLVKYYLKNCHTIKNITKLPLVVVGTFICAIIFLVAFFSNFATVGYILIVLFACIFWFCLRVRESYRVIDRLLGYLDDQLCPEIKLKPDAQVMTVDEDQLTAIIIFDDRGPAMHTLLNINRLFAGQYKNFVFVGIGIVDSFSIAGKTKVVKLENKLKADLGYFETFCKNHQVPFETHLALGVDYVEQAQLHAEQLAKKYPHSVFFSSQLVFPEGNWMLKMLSNKTTLMVQQNLYALGLYMMLLPVKVSAKS